MSEWISVNHDLPQVGQEIKFKIGELTYSEGKLASLTTIDYGSRRDVYGDFELEGRSKYKFTHWQPLPDPPKPEGPFSYSLSSKRGKLLVFNNKNEYCLNENDIFKLLDWLNKMWAEHKP
jgi:hypothetical protein